ncbi:MAG TPA: CopD family protein [Sphingomonas sp.]
MEGWLGDAYPWVKAAHLIVVIFWMAGLFMLPRFLIYQVSTVPGSPEDHAWSERTRRLRTIILSPAMILVWLLGLALAVNIGAFSMAWFHAKLALVLLLSGYHGWAIGASRRIAAGHRPASDRRLRLLNEVPSIATILIVILVIVRPF